jgi:hypothetical protein
MLELPADIIAKIHNGEVSAEAAYELGRVPEERRSAVLERAIEDVTKAANKEEKEEEKLLKAEQAEQAQADKADKAAKDAETAKADQEAAAKLVEEKTLALRKVLAENYDPSDTQARASWEEKRKGAETDVKAAQSLNKKAKNKVAKFVGEKSAAEELKDKLAQARKGVPAVGPTAVKKAHQKDKQTPAGAAAAAKQPASSSVALTAAQIKDGLRDMAKTENPLVLKVVGIFADYCKGELTPKLALEEFEKFLKVRPVVKK